jgi:MATE family multidrug resistance protein
MVRTIAFGGIALSGFVMLAFAALYSGLTKPIAAMFNSDPEVIALASGLLIIAGLFQLADGVQVTAMGSLRGLADVRVRCSFLSRSIGLSRCRSATLELSSAGLVP